MLTKHWDVQVDDMFYTQENCGLYFQCGTCLQHGGRNLLTLMTTLTPKALRRYSFMDRFNAVYENEPFFVLFLHLLATGGRNLLTLLTRRAFHVIYDFFLCF